MWICGAARAEGNVTRKTSARFREATPIQSNCFPHLPSSEELSDQQASLKIFGKLYLDSVPISQVVLDAQSGNLEIYKVHEKPQT